MGKARSQRADHHPDPDERQHHDGEAEPDRGGPAGGDERHRDAAQHHEVDDQGHAHEADHQLDAQCACPVTHVKSRKGSRPTVRPGCWPTVRTASNTPGTNEVRSRLSCRIVRVSPWVPNSTSWWATSPANRTE